MRVKQHCQTCRYMREDDMARQSNSEGVGGGNGMPFSHIKANLPDSRKGKKRKTPRLCIRYQGIGLETGMERRRKASDMLLGYKYRSNERERERERERETGNGARRGSETKGGWRGGGRHFASKTISDARSLITSSLFFVSLPLFLLLLLLLRA